MVSHRGVDEDVAGAAPSTKRSITALLDAGISSFDVDLFWTFDDKNLFVGHPPSLRKLWRLKGEVHETTLAVLRQRAEPDGVLSLSDMLRILAGRRRALGQVSLELKFPAHHEWRKRLSTLYQEINAARLAAKVAVIVLDAEQAAAHRAAQAIAGLRVPVLVVLRDSDAAVGPDGAPHANLTALLASQDLYDGWSASWKILDGKLRHAATKPLAVWTVDSDEALQRSWTVQADDVVTNRPQWARQLLKRWEAEEQLRCDASPRGS